MGWKKNLINGGKLVANQIAPDVMNFGAKIGVDIIEKQKNLIKIPNLKDVVIDEALRVLKEDLNLAPTSAIVKPRIAYADGNENEVLYSEPRFGSRVNPGTTVKVYYLTKEVIEKSKKLLGKVIEDFKVPKVVGLNIYEARQDLEDLGLRVTEKLEKPSIKFISRVDGQVTRITYANGQKIGSRLKTSERVWIYYVNEEVILESMSIKENRDKDKQKKMAKIDKAGKGALKMVKAGAVEVPKNIAKGIKKPFKKKK